MSCCVVFFFKQKTAYELRISDWSSDVCSSDLAGAGALRPRRRVDLLAKRDFAGKGHQLQRVFVGVEPGIGAWRCKRDLARSEERRVGEECVRTCRSRALQYH